MNHTSIVLRELRRRTMILTSFAALSNSVYHFVLTERAYILYIKVIEANHGVNSLEASNCYFLIGSFYLENNYLKKAMACFRKCLDIRVRQFKLKPTRHESNLEVHLTEED